MWRKSFLVIKVPPTFCTQTPHTVSGCVSHQLMKSTSCVAPVFVYVLIKMCAAVNKRLPLAILILLQQQQALEPFRKCFNQGKTPAISLRTQQSYKTSIHMTTFTHTNTDTRTHTHTYTVSQTDTHRQIHTTTHTHTHTQTHTHTPRHTQTHSHNQTPT